MRRIKTYVMTVGVALLSAAPIFNYALAQQGNNSTQLLLQVQTMRQEIAELRDMVERQQFQLKRLQKQSEAQFQQRDLSQGPGASAPGYVERPNYNDGLSPSQNAAVNQANSGTAQIVANQVAPNNGVAQTAYNESTSPSTGISERQATNWAVGQTPNDGDLPRSIEPSQVPVAAANQNAYSSSTAVAQQQAGSNYPPVIDRSINNVNPSVPVTGEGTRLPTSTDFQTSRRQEVSAVAGQAQSQSIESAANLETFSQENRARVSSVPLASTSLPANGGGVVSIPAQVTQASGQAQSAIDASQIPTQIQSQSQGLVEPLAATSNSQLANAATTSQVSAAAVLSENDYYGQGFELLKQSKYEEAASIFEQQLKAYPSGDLADDAHYWIAEAMHVSRKLDVAKVHLKTIISDYPQSRRLPDAMLKTAYIEQSQGNQIEARILFQEIVNRHPQSDAAIAAKNQLAAAN